MFRPSAGQPSAAIYYYIQFQQMAGCIGCIYNKHNNRKSAFTEKRTTAVKLCNNFESKLFYELCLIAGINKSHTTAFHPQSDGQTERMNRTLLQMLKTTADDNPATWPQRLPTVMAAYRMAVHKTTGMTPNMAMLGREVMLSAALLARPPRSLTALLCLSFTTSDAHQRVRDATKSSARTQKVYYDDRSRQAVFAEGQLVWLLWPRPPVRQKFRKLQRLWTGGPWRIELFKSPLLVVLKHTEKRTRQTVHVDRLLLCRTPPPVVPQADS